uniref:Cytochrome b6-f complex subunit 6 n=1 Tax=Vertebrata thuyoides TaxID=2006970 RepID=A0A1Z1MAV1_9FLOR|nr:cytochrome b6-f complex subunit 6 [Vertebrata thuyoides]ARW63090.1 cytochrome b6-f complex subunit 6 [Vertebrata thuyoides]
MSIFFSYILFVIIFTGLALVLYFGLQFVKLI